MVFKVIFTIMNVMLLGFIFMSVHRIFKKNEAIKVEFESNKRKMYTLLSYMGIAVIITIIILMSLASRASDVEAQLTTYYEYGLLTYVLLFISVWLMSPKKFIVSKQGLYYEYRFGPYKKICESNAVKDYSFNEKNQLQIKYLYKLQQVLEIKISGDFNHLEMKSLEKLFKKKIKSA